MTTETILCSGVKEARRQKLILPIGSGRTGKTFWSRWLLDRAIGTQSPPLIIDGDSINPGLAPLYEGAMTVPHTTFAGDRQAWFEKTIEAAVVAGRSALIDFGPRLFGLDDWLADAQLGVALEDAEVDIVAVYLLTPNAYSLPRLPYLIDLIKPTRTLVVLNEWGFDGDEARDAFAPILADPIVTAARADGARIVAMPHLAAADELEGSRGLPRGVPKVSTDNLAFSARLRRMEENFVPVADWLA